MRFAFPWLAIPLLCGLPASAQTQLVASTPRTGAVIAHGATTFRLRFNQRVDNAECSLSLVPASGQQRALPLQAQSASDEIEALGTILTQGSYRLGWQIAAPGVPVVRGSVTFNVH